MISKYESFKEECKSYAEKQSKDNKFQKVSYEWFKISEDYKYSYNFECLGRPIIQYPQDIIATQEVIYKVKPDLIIETGIAHGGSLIFSSSQLCLIDLMEGKDPKTSNRKVLGIDIDIRSHNKDAIENHPLSFKIKMLEGSSIDPLIVDEVHNYAKNFKKIMLFLDSNHAENHVLGELDAYSSLVSKGSYCIVYDTCVELLEPGSFPNRPWDVGNSPMSALSKWLPNNNEFEIDYEIDNKLMFSVAPKGYLRKK